MNALILKLGGAAALLLLLVGCGRSGMSSNTKLTETVYTPDQTAAAERSITAAPHIVFSATEYDLGLMQSGRVGSAHAEN